MDDIGKKVEECLAKDGKMHSMPHNAQGIIIDECHLHGSENYCKYSKFFGGYKICFYHSQAAKDIPGDNFVIKRKEETP